MDDYYFHYRGDVRAILGNDHFIALVTTHPEGLPGAIAYIDTESQKYLEYPLAAGGVALCYGAPTVYVACTDHRVYQLVSSKAPKSLTDRFEFPIVAIACVSQDRLAVLIGQQLAIVSRTDGSVTQLLPLADVGTCFATDKTGAWIAVGGEKGTVSVFDGQDKPEFELSETGKLHDGRVTTLMFEPEELRFFSAGADNKLLSTHARGRLEPEDKGRTNTHASPIISLVGVPIGDRIITGSSDKTLKNWPRAGGVKPQTLSDRVGEVVSLTMVQQYGDWRIAVACADNTIRIIPLNEEDGRFRDDDGDEFDELIETYHGALAWANNEFEDSWDSKRRERAMKQLATWNDTASLELLAKRISEDKDASTRAVAARLLCDVQNPRVATLLEPFLTGTDPVVRKQAFIGLQKQLGASDYRPIDAALKSGHPEIGVLAVKALTPLAKTDDQALTRLTTALNANQLDVRRQALTELEAVNDPQSPQASLTALTTTHGDLRALALQRLFDRKLLDRSEVRSAVRRKLEDDDAAVRKMAFLLSLAAHPKLAEGLRSHDEEWHRQLNELEKKDGKPPAVTDGWSTTLDAAAYDALLQATASRALDTCLRGAKGLAILGDGRAFPLLLQLSREEQEYARVEVCRALAALNDPRAVNRLRSLLLDPQASVRDAAYTAIAKLYTKEPLSAAQAGLFAANEDVRQRGLQTLQFATKRSKPKSGDAAWNLFLQALNDTTANVRREAFKSALNQGIGGGGEATLRFVLQSIHADVRREVLTEVQAQLAEPWATPLLYEFFNDPDVSLRNEAFEIATKKNKELAPLEACLKSKYAETRIVAIQALLKKHTKAAQALILTTIRDCDATVRKAAIDALIDDGATASVVEALQADAADVRVRAAQSLARRGDSTSLPVLSALAFAPEPHDKYKFNEWISLVEDGLLGLSELGDPTVFEKLLELIDSSHDAIRRVAALALAGCTPHTKTDIIRLRVNHADPAVRFWLLQTLANHGDETVHPLLAAPEFEKYSSPQLKLQTIAALGRSGAARLVTFLDSTDIQIRQQTVFLHVLLEFAGTDGTPDLLLQVLSAREPRVRLAAAQGLEAFHDRKTWDAFVLATLNDRGDESAWKLTADVVEDLAAVLAFGEPLMRTRACNLLKHFGTKESAAFTQALDIFRKRYSTQLADAQQQLKSTNSALTQAELRQLAFGAYVGLTREQGSNTATPAVSRVRQTALSRIHAIASSDKTYTRDAQPILSQSLTDTNQTVRLQAFEHLQSLGIPKATLGAEALEAGFTDLGVKGLELLTGGTSGEGDAVLERVLLSRTDDLAIEAAKLLVKSQGRVKVATTALDAVHEPLRTLAVDWLTGEYADSADAQKSLRTAVTSRYRKVREQAALALALKKDTTAFDTLATLLKESTDSAQQHRIAAAFVALGDKRAADVLLTRVENDPTGTVDFEAMLDNANEFRLAETAPRFIAIAERYRTMPNAPTDSFESALGGAYIVSGFEQDLPDPDDEAGYAKAEKELKPLQPDVLRQILEYLTQCGRISDYLGVIEKSRGSRGNAVDAILATLVAHSDEDTRHRATADLGWRVKHRGSSPEALLKALKHKDSTTQFLAAEGLAKAGKADGMQILLSSMEYLDDIELRQRAVLALGELAEPRAIDVLLKLATDTGHALQEAAVEAIGHLRRSPKADEIGKLLERLSKSPMTGVMQRSLVGLRWFDSPSGWQIIRQKAKDSNWRTREVACKQLRYDSDPATKTLLLEILRTERDNDAMEAALESAIVLCGVDSLDPYYAAVLNPRWGTEEIGDAERVPIDEVTKRGDVLKILELFPLCSVAVQQRLEASLIGRPTVPMKEAVAGLAHADPATVRLAARLVAKNTKPTADVKQKVNDTLKAWWEKWQTHRADLDTRKVPTPQHHGRVRPRYPIDDGDVEEPSVLDNVSRCLQTLMWSANQVGGPSDELLIIATARPDDREAKPIRLEAIRILAATNTLSEPTLVAIEQLANDIDAEIRTLSASVLAKADAKRTSKLTANFLTDRPTLSRVQSVGGTLGNEVKDAAANANQQSVALPALIAANDYATLAKVATDRKAAEPVRLGAVEGLGFMATENAEKILVEIGTTDGDDEDVRKAAWRALRRSKRRRMANQNQPAGQV